MMTTFGELNTGDMFRYIGGRGWPTEVFRKADPRTAVQQREDGSGDLHSVDAMVKTLPRTAVLRVTETEQVDNATKAASLLQEAAAKIETALVLLDMRERDCGECGTRHFTNKVHAKTYQQFTNTPHGLRTRAEELVQQAADNNSNTAALSAKEQ